MLPVVFLWQSYISSEKFNFNTICQIKIPDIPHTLAEIPFHCSSSSACLQSLYIFSIFHFFLNLIVLYKCWPNHSLLLHNNVDKLYCPFLEGILCRFHRCVLLGNQTHKNVHLRSKHAQSLFSFLLPHMLSFMSQDTTALFYHSILKYKASLITAKSCKFCSFTAVVHMLEWKWQENIILSQAQNEKL